MSQPTNIPEDPDGQEPAPRRDNRRRLPVTTLALAGVLVLAIGFVGGIGVSKLATPAAEGNGAMPGNGVPTRMQGKQGSATVGTVQKVVGNTVYVKTPDGKTVKVTTDDDTKVRISKPGSVKDLDKGSTVVVRGDSTGDDGVSAKSIDQGGGRVVRPGQKP